MNNILSLKTVGLSYASTNLSFAFALYFNISMFLLYHNPPLFSITCRTCPNVFLFGVQIPVDACPLFGLKRRSFLFVIDKNEVQASACASFFYPDGGEPRSVRTANTSRLHRKLLRRCENPVGVGNESRPAGRDICFSLIAAGRNNLTTYVQLCLTPDFRLVT